MSGSSRAALPDAGSGRAALLDAGGGWEAPRMCGIGRETLRMSGNFREALPNVRVWSGGPPGCPGVVGRPSRMSRSGR